MSDTGADDDGEQSENKNDSGDNGDLDSAPFFNPRDLLLVDHQRHVQRYFCDAPISRGIIEVLVF